MIGLKRGTVFLSDHDREWSKAFLRECERLRPVIGTVVGPFEHVGSTAVPGIPAKPIIDLMVGVDSIDQARALIEPLARLGYEYRPNGDLPERILLVLGPEECRTHHLSLVICGGQEWKNSLAFRDFLSAHPETAQQYAKLKCALAAKFANDRPSYTREKVAFIENILNATLAGESGNQKR